MNAGPDVERRISAWLAEELQTLAPDRILPAAFDRSRRTHQRRFGAVWRTLPMNGNAWRFAAAAAVVVLIFVAGAAYLGMSGTPGGIGAPAASPTPTAIPTPTAMASPTVMPFPTGTSGGEPVAPGTYALDLTAPSATSGAAVPMRITITMPDGWEKNRVPQVLWSVADQRTIGFKTVDNLIADPCRAQAGPLLDPPLGPTVGDLVAGLRGLAAVASTTPRDVVVSGFTGTEIELTGEAQIEQCVDGNVALWAGPQGAVAFDGGAYLGANDTQHLLIVDVGGARLVINRSRSPDTSSEADLAELQAIVDSIQIEIVE